ncbi:SDR family oxidoreductase [Streptomyces sp. MUM 203J]|uniref:SDR family oxidoreductase n=1 Tax=Streptomyces sp. MUM 203J TaxID=2791990 RepID=UPI0023D9685A|nr:SDR family oxidoreductase [Streptomyces sp. MUM 203J]
MNSLPAASGPPGTRGGRLRPAARIPLGRRGGPGEVAAWMLRPADPAAAWLTGQILTIDGGLEPT